MTGTGKAIVNTPANAHKAPTNIPTTYNFHINYLYSFVSLLFLGTIYSPMYVFGAISPVERKRNRISCIQQVALLR